MDSGARPVGSRTCEDRASGGGSLDGQSRDARGDERAAAGQVAHEMQARVGREDASGRMPDGHAHADQVVHEPGVAVVLAENRADMAV